MDESLRRLQTDRIDLVQHHEILRYEDPHRIFDEEGANAALVDDVEQALEAARTFRPMSDEEVRKLLARTEKAASKGEFELFKTTSIFDATTYHPDWLGEEPERVQRAVHA